MADDAADKLDDETFGFLDYLMHWRNGILTAQLRNEPGRDRTRDDSAISKLLALGFVEIVNEPKQLQRIVATPEGQLAWETESLGRAS